MSQSENVDCALDPKLPVSNTPFRGGKGGLHEGGVRLPRRSLPRGETVLDPAYNIDAGLPTEKPALPK